MCITAPLSKLSENNRLVCFLLNSHDMTLYFIDVFGILCTILVHIHVIVIHNQGIIGKRIELNQGLGIVCPVFCTAYDEHLVLRVLPDCFNQFKHTTVLTGAAVIVFLLGLFLARRLVR